MLDDSAIPHLIILGVRSQCIWQFSHSIWHTTDWVPILSAVGISTWCYPTDQIVPRVDLRDGLCGGSHGHALPSAARSPRIAYTQAVSSTLSIKSTRTGARRSNTATSTTDH